MGLLLELSTKAVELIKEAREKGYFSRRHSRKEDGLMDYDAVHQAFQDNEEWQKKAWDFLSSLVQYSLEDLHISSWSHVDWYVWLVHATFHDNRYDNMCSAKSVESASLIINKYEQGTNL